MPIAPQSAAKAASQSAAQAASQSAPPATTLAPAVLTPLADCVVDAAVDGGQTARTIVFGYRNDAASAVTLAAGSSDNAFVPGTADRSQPGVFQPGEHHGAFTVAVDADATTPGSWMLGGTSAAVTAQTPPCATVTSLALSAPATVSAGATVTLTAAVSRMFLPSPDSGQIAFGLDSAAPSLVSVDASGLARIVLPAPRAGRHTVTARFVPAGGSTLLAAHAQTDLTVTAAPASLTIASSGLTGGGTRAIVTVSRASAAGTASVDYTTADGTAKAGTDYTTTRGTLTLRDGQLSSTISIPLATRSAGASGALFFVLLQRATTSVDTAAATVTLPAVATSPSGTGAGAVVLDDRSGGGTDSVLPVADPTGKSALTGAASDLALLIGAALLTGGGILGLIGLVRFGGSRNAQA